jgi:low temperature requirement protein LtrA
MVQMIGVVVLALGMPQVFHSLDAGHTLDNGVLVAGYVIMRVAMVAQWLRAARQDPDRRQVALTYAGFIVVAQVGWVVLAVLHLDLGPTFALAGVLYLIEVGGPVMAERKGTANSGSSTPWHAHHVAERYGLLTIIALGEGVFGTIASVSAVVEGHGWSLDAAIIALGGIGLTFGLWWSYFTMPSGLILHHFRNRSWVWGYGHIVVFAAIAATGAGLHVVALVVEGEAHLSESAAVLAVAIPVLVFLVSLFALYAYMVRTFDPFHLGLFAVTLALIVAAAVMAQAGVALSVCLGVVTLAPFVVVVGYETVGHRHAVSSLRRLLS